MNNSETKEKHRMFRQEKLSPRRMETLSEFPENILQCKKNEREVPWGSFSWVFRLHLSYSRGENKSTKVHGAKKNHVFFLEELFIRIGILEAEKYIILLTLLETTKSSEI